MKLIRSTAPRGFTLIEIMLALFIVATILAAIFSTWTAITRGSKVGLDAAAAAQRSRVAVRTIEIALTSARSFAADLENYSFIAENGGEASLSFVARLPESFPRGGKFGDFDVRRVTFSLERGPEYGKQLVLRQTPLLMEMDVDEEDVPVVLANNVERFEMQFWERNGRDWVDEWTEAQTNHLPAMVKITLEFGGNNQQSRVRNEITRVVSLPSITVPPAWQTPGRQGQ